MGNGKGGDMTAPDPVAASDSVTILKKLFLFLKQETEVEANTLYTSGPITYVSPSRT